MAELNYENLSEYIGKNIVEQFNKARIGKINEVRLNEVIKRKNPYLFKAKNISTAESFVTEILSAYISSQEETLFGTYLEQLAIYISGIVYDGKKSSAEGIDLELSKDNVYYIVTIKSGPNWANNSQLNKMLDNFRKTRRILGTNSISKVIVAVNGCCYGKDNSPQKEEYLKLCGQRFWEFISGDTELYQKIIVPLGEESKERDDEFKEAYSTIINRLTKEFLDNYSIEGKIDWEKILKYNSGK